MRILHYFTIFCEVFFNIQHFYRFFFTLKPLSINTFLQKLCTIINYQLKFLASVSLFLAKFYDKYLIQILNHFVFQIYNF